MLQLENPVPCFEGGNFGVIEVREEAEFIVFGGGLGRKTCVLSTSVQDFNNTRYRLSE